MAAVANFILILKTLRAHDVEFIVVGGVSAVLNGAPVSTFDVDIVHKRTSDNVGRLKTALAELNAHDRGRRSQAIQPDTPQLMSPAHQLLLTDAGPLDVLGALGDIEYDNLLNDTTEFTIDNISGIRVLNLDRLILLKESLGRDKDNAVLPILRRTFEEQQGH